MMAFLIFGSANAIQDIPMTSEFAQLDMLKRIIIQPDEEFKVELNEYFRGQFLQFDIVSSTNEEKELIDARVVKITDPVSERINIQIRDSPEPIALQYTTDIFKNEYDDTFLIFLDQDAKLYIYDISLYYVGSADLIKLISKTDIYDKTYMAESRSCQHLTPLIESQLYFLLCLSNKGVDQSSVVVINTTEDQTYSKPRVKYYHTDISYSFMTNGRMKLLQDYNGTFDIILLQNKTSSNYQIYNIGQDFKITKKETFSQIQYPDFSQFSQLSTITDLTLQDVLPLSEFQGVILLSDYQTGVYIQKIECNITDCQSFTYSRVSIKSASKMQLLQQSQNEFIPNVLLSLVQPPRLIEINIQDFINPFISKNYKISSDDGVFIGMNVVDADEQYIALQIMKLDDFKPFIRVYSRNETMNSFALRQFVYADVYMYGHYLSFLKYNHFLLKTSDFFRIYKIQSTILDINTHNSTIFNQTNIFNKTQHFELGVKDYKGNKMTCDIEIIFLETDSNETLTTFSEHDENQTLNSTIPTIYYNCGIYRNLSVNNSDTMYDILYIDNLFSGPIGNLQIESLSNDTYPYFNVTTPSVLGEYQILNIDFSECQSNQLTHFIVGDQYDYQLACIGQNEFRIFFIDILIENSQINPVNNFTIQEINIAAYIIDTKHDMIFAFVDRNRKGQDQLTMHVFKLYNILSWQTNQKIGDWYPEQLKEYKLDPVRGVSYNQELCMGLLISEKDDQGEVVIYAFKFDQENDYKFVLLAENKMSLGNYDIIQASISSANQYWILFSNQTVKGYQTVKILDNQNRMSNSLDYLFKVTSNLEFQKTKIGNTTRIWSLSYNGNKFLAFAGQNMIITYNQEAKDIVIESNTSLPLSYINQDIKRQYYSFVIDNESMAIYKIYDKYLFVLFNDTLNQVFMLNIYDTTTWRHNALMAEIQIPEEFVVDINYIKFHSIQKSDANLILILQSKYQALSYTVSCHYSMQISGKNAMKLDEKCITNDDGVENYYLLYPSGNKDQQAIVRVVAKNNGLLIRPNQYTVTAYVNTLQNPPYVDSDYIDAAFSINEWFDGYDVRFNYEILKTDDNPGALSGNIKTSKLPESMASSPIEFITNKNRIFNFYTLNDSMIILDTDGLLNVVYSIKNSGYERVKADDIFGCVPNVYTEYFFPYFIFQCNITNNGQNQIRFGMTLIYPKKKPVNALLGEYKSFNDKIWVKFTQPQQKLTKAIQTSAICKVSEENVIIVLSFDIPNQEYLSTVQFYNTTIDKQTHDIAINFISTYTITSNDINYDQFRVTAMAVLPSNLELIIAVQDYGLIIVDMLDGLIKSQISLIKQMRFQTFKVMNIVVQDQSNVHLIMNKLGIICVQIYDEEYLENEMVSESSGTIFDDNQQEAFEITTYFNFGDKETVNYNYMAIDTQGFAFLTQQPMMDGGIFIKQLFKVRYFGYYYSDNSKLLTSRHIDQGLDCSLLRAYPRDLAIEELNFQTDDSYIMTSLLCGADLYYQLISRTNILNVVHDEDFFKSYELKQTLNLTVFNNHSQNSMMVELYLINFASSKSPIYYILFILVISLCLFAFQLIIRSVNNQKEKQQGRSKSAKNKSSNHNKLNRKSNHITGFFMTTTMTDFDTSTNQLSSVNALAEYRISTFMTNDEVKYKK